MIPLFPLWNIPFAGNFIVIGMMWAWPHIWIPSTFPDVIPQKTLFQQQASRTALLNSLPRAVGGDVYSLFSSSTERFFTRRRLDYTVNFSYPYKIEEISRSTAELEQLSLSQLQRLKTGLGLRGPGLARVLKDEILEHSAHILQDDQLLRHELPSATPQVLLDKLGENALEEALLERGLTWKNSEDAAEQLHLWLQLSHRSPCSVLPFWVHAYGWDDRPVRLSK